MTRPDDTEPSAGITHVEVSLRGRPGKCGDCGRRYRDSLFGVDEYIKQNMTGIKFLANKNGEDVAVAIKRDRERHAAWLAAHGFENCERDGCKKAIKPVGGER